MSLPNEPIGRRETYLARIAGQDVSLPAEPLNREEAYLDYIAKNGGSGGAVIDDTEPASDKVYSSEKVEEDKYKYEADITTRKLNLTRDMEISNITSEGTVYLFANENIAYMSDVAEATNKDVTYKIKDGLIYLNGTASGTFYIDVDIVIPDNWENQSILGNIETVSGSRSGGNIKINLPCTYMSSNEEKQMSIGVGSKTNMKLVHLSNVQAKIQVSSGAVTENCVLRPYFTYRTQQKIADGWTNRPTPSRIVVTGSLSNTEGILMTMSADFTAHVKSKYPLDVLFGKRLALCGDSIAEGHSADSFGYTIAENENMSFDKPAIGTACFTSNSPVTSITSQVYSLTKDYDYIIIEGGINDTLHGYTVGTLTSGFDAVSYDETTVLGAVEKALRRLVENYPGAKKLFVLCHKCTNASYVPYADQETYFAAIITALEKWNIPYIDLRKFPLCAYNADFAAAYFGSDFSSVGGLHPKNAGYRLGYIDQIIAKMKTL